MDAHHDLLIQHHEAEAPDSSVGSAPSLVHGEAPSGGRNIGNEATSSASSPKSGPHGKKQGQLLSIVALHSLSFSVSHHA